jgi:LuxR family maltose regulon positive regulatory protein
MQKTRSNKTLDPIDDRYINTLLRVFEEEKSRLEVPVDEDDLSSREMDILHLIAKGFSNQIIAEKLFISNNTVKTHVRNILFKLEAKNRNEAVQVAREKGIVLS